MYELGTRHARLEAEKQLDALMDTLIENPVYEFYPLRLTMHGGDTVRRYYQQFMDDFMNKISGYRLGGERIYGSERLIRLMTGTLFDELSPMSE